MSTIHKALKKAQREKDSRYQDYEGVLGEPLKKRAAFPPRVFWMVGLSCGVCVISFFAYLRFYPHNRKPPVGAEPAATETVGAHALEKTVAVPLKKDIVKDAPVQDAKVLYGQAKAFQKSGRLTEAMQLYQEILQIEPAHVDALNNLGVILLHEKNYDAARRTFEKAVRISPNSVDPCYNLACVYALKGDPIQAVAALKKAGSLDPEVKKWAKEDPDLRSLRGIPEFEAIIKTGLTGDP